MSQEKINNFWDEFWDDAKVESKAQTSKFLQKPPTAIEFFDKWTDTPLFPKQQEIVEAVFANNYQDMSTNYNEFVEAIGKRGGKDYTIANLLAYQIAWLLHMPSPQEYLGIKDGEPIDIVNISFDEEQARTVFFEKFTNRIKNTNNPGTGKNFFEEQGMNFNRDIQKTYIQFPKNIRAFSLNSIKFKAEGKNIVFAVFDEIGSFRFDKAEAIRKHIKTTAKMTSVNFFKLFYISFLTSSNDYMAYLIDLAEKGELYNAHFMRAATWDVRTKENCPKKLLKYIIKKEDYQDDYDEDPESAALMYECKIPKIKKDAFIKRPNRILKCIGTVTANGETNYRPDPRIDQEKLWVYDDELMELEFEPWLRPYYTYEINFLEKLYEKNPSDELQKRIIEEKQRQNSAVYSGHLDLSRGVVDCASLVIGHTYKILDKLKLYIDIMLQIRARKDSENSKEIDMSNILDFILKRLVKPQRNNGLGFKLNMLSADGWQSALFLNLCQKDNIDAKVISLEKNPEPYHTLKDFIYRGDLNMYYFPVVIRELTELLVTDKKKIDHPRRSKWRMREESLPFGSKDISDGLGGLSSGCMDSGDNSPLWFGGTK